MIFPSKVFDVLKWICMIALPAFTTFYGTVGLKLDWPAVEQVVIFLTGFTTLLGTLLGVSHVEYYRQSGLEMQEPEEEVDHSEER